MSLFTLEDANGVVFRDGTHSVVFEVDTSLISSTGDFSDVLYDFVKVSRSTSGITKTFSFEIANSLWGGYFYVLDSDRNYYTPSTFNLEDNVLTIETDEDSIILGLIIDPFHTGTVEIPQIASLISKDLSIDLKLDELGEHRFTFTDLVAGEEYSQAVTINNFGSFTDADLGNAGLARLVKTGFLFNCTQTLKTGKINTIQLGADTRYKPGGARIGTYTPSITVTYNKETIPVYYDSDIGDYVFDLDLSNTTTPGTISFTVEVEENKVLEQSNTIVKLNCTYETITTFNDLIIQCGAGGANEITLTNDITFTTDLTVKHNITIIGADNTLEMDGHKIKLDEGVSFKATNTLFNEADTCIIQAQNTTVELDGCTFTNCTSTDYEGLGGCIFCDVTIDSLTVPDDFTTTLTGCTFTNNNTPIFHGGTLTIKDCLFTNNSLTYLDEDSPAFLYQTDGDAYISGSRFKVNPPETLCSNQKTAGFGQCVFTLGENATLNGQTHKQLLDNTPNLTESPYNNQSYVYWKYYYPSITSCVYTSPQAGYESKSYCYALSGVNWVYKANAQVTQNNPNNNPAPF